MKHSYKYKHISIKSQRFMRGASPTSTHFVYLPGGFGLKCSYLKKVASKIEIPGTHSFIDLKATKNPSIQTIESWKEEISMYLREVSSQGHCILLGHSCGGMLALTLPKIKNLLSALILIDSSPDKRWMKCAELATKKIRAPKSNLANIKYQNKKNNQNLKKLFVSWAPYYFKEANQRLGIKALQGYGYDYMVYEAGNAVFNPKYKALSKFRTLPVLILHGANDLITPINLFDETIFDKKNNVLFKTIPHSMHFPWVENPGAFFRVLNKYLQKVIT